MPEPIVYAVVHMPQGDVAMRYTGMGLQVISDMLAAQGVTANILTKEEYEAILADAGK